MRTVAVIEARMGSSRLPGKVMMPLAGSPLIEHVVKRVQACSSLDDIVLATTVKEADTVLEKTAKELGIRCFRGSEDDVLSRVVGAAESVDGDVIVKLSGDNPLYHPTYVDPIVEAFKDNEDCDFISNTAMGFSQAWKEERLWPVGTGVMVMRRSTLAATQAEIHDEADREHVIRFIIEQPDRYRLKAFHPTGRFSVYARPELRFCVDTGADLNFFQQIFSSLYSQNQIFGLREVIELVAREPELLEIIKDIQQRAI